MSVTREAISVIITERLANVDSERLELLQFHWQDVRSFFIFVKQYLNFS
jgi:hypothetical protein